MPSSNREISVMGVFGLVGFGQSATTKISSCVAIVALTGMNDTVLGQDHRFLQQEAGVTI